MSTDLETAEMLATSVPPTEAQAQAIRDAWNRPHDGAPMPDALRLAAGLLPLPASRVEITREPLTYERHLSQCSYFADLARWQVNRDEPAHERLQRHAAEMRVELPKRYDFARARAGDVGLEYRVNPNRLTGEGGYFAPPLWLDELFATAPRPARAFANEIPHFDLPFGVSSVNLPRLTTGTTNDIQPDLAPVTDVDIVDAQGTSPAVPFSGQADVALQLLEQSQVGASIDALLFKDLTESYDNQLELMLLNGLGTANSESFYGLLQESGTNSVTYTASAPSATGMFGYLGQAASKTGNNRKLPPEAWIMTTSRLAWLGSSEDTQNRPLILANRNGPGEVDLLTFPVLLSDAMPITQGAGGNQDAIIACRPSDSILLETPTRANVFTEVLSGTLMAHIQLHGYAASIHRYPSGVSILSGTGMVVQSGFNN